MSAAVPVVILAGGEGSRIGGDKPLRTLDGHRLVDRAAALARRYSSLVAVATRRPDQLGEGVAHAMAIFDDPTVSGPIGGLLASLRFASARGCTQLMIIPADMPFLPPDMLERLLAAMRDQRCAMASSGGRLHPVCSAWRTEVLQSAPEYLATGKQSLRGFAEWVGFAVAEWEATPDPFFNVNLVEDLAEAERRLAG